MTRKALGWARWVGLATIGAVGLAWAVILLSAEPTYAPAVANGSYANACCGTVVLHNGELTSEGAEPVSYAVREDKTARYALPNALVGIVDGRRITVEPAATPLKLYLGGDAHPATIQLYDVAGARAYVFVRKR